MRLLAIIGCVFVLGLAAPFGVGAAADRLSCTVTRDRNGDWFGWVSCYSYDTGFSATALVDLERACAER